MNANQIKKNLIPWIRTHAWDIIIPNYFYHQYEADVFKLQRNGLFVEYEIKVSRSDFKADFEKGTTGWLGEKIEGKHDGIAQGKRCNRFFFVVPENLIKVEDVPGYAGLIYAKPLNQFEVIKNAPLIHKKKIEDNNLIFRGLANNLCAREMSAQSKLRRLANDLAEANKKITRLTDFKK